MARQGKPDSPNWSEWRVGISPGHPGDLSDGMLAYFNWAVQFSDTTVEARLEKEPFDFRDEMLKGKSDARAKAK